METNTAAGQAFVAESAPHRRKARSVDTMLLDVLVALLPVIAMAVVYYPFETLRNLGVSVLTTEVLELVGLLMMKRIPYDGKKHSFGERMKHSFSAYRLSNFLSALVTGLIYGLISPVRTDSGSFIYYVLVIGAAAGMILGKLVFGGLGKNIFNPAAVGFVFAKVCFGSHYVYPVPKYASEAGSLVSAGATPLGADNFAYKGSTLVLNTNAYSLLDLFLGKVPGVLGEGCKAAILVGLLYLLLRRTIDWRVPLSALCSFLLVELSAGIIYLIHDHSFVLWQYLSYQLLSGGFLFAVTFLLNDPVTEPITRPTRWIYGALFGSLVVLLRLFASAPEAAAYSVLIVNMLASVMDYYKWAKPKFSWKSGLWLALVVVVPALITVWALSMEVL